MKKSLLSFIMICCLLMTALVPMASATEIVYSFAASTATVYDKNGDVKEVDANAAYVTLTELESMEFDVSDLTSGTYVVTVEYATNLNVKNAVYLDAVIGGILTNRKMLPDTGGTGSDAAALNTFKKYVLGEIYISESTASITFRNSSKLIVDNQNLMPTVRIKNFTFDYVNLADVSDVEIVSSAAHNVKNTTAGNGYYCANSHDMLTGGNNVIVGVNDGTPQALFHYQDWFTYDISELKAGTYRMYLNVASTAARTVTVSVDGTDKITNAPTVATPTVGITDEAENDIGLLYITDDAQTLKIAPNSTMYVSSFTLKLVDDSDILSNTSKTINGYADCIEATKGSANAVVTTDFQKESSANGYAIVIYNNGYTKYDASSLNGTYKVSVDWMLNNANTLKTVTFNGVSNELNIVADGTYKTTEMGIVNFDGTANQILQITATISGGALRIRTITLTRVESQRTNKTISGLDDCIEATKGGTNEVVTTDFQKENSSNGYAIVIYNNGYAKYDASDLKGTYTVVIDWMGTASNTLKTISINDISFDLNMVEDGTYKTSEFGTVTFSGEEKQSLKIGVTISGGAFRIRTITLIPLNESYKFTNSDGTEISSIGDNTDIDAYIAVKNDKDKTMGTVIIAAVYKGDEFIYSESYYINIAAYGTVPYTFENINVTDATEVKLFAWTAYEADGKAQITMIPLCASKSLPKTAAQ